MDLSEPHGDTAWSCRKHCEKYRLIDVCIMMQNIIEQRGILRISKLTSGERLRRKAQAQAVMRNGERPLIENLIVMGASAGGINAAIEIPGDLSIDIPAAIVILLHMRLGTKYDLKATLGRFTRIPIVPVESSEPLRHQTIFIPPPGKSASFHRRMIIVDHENVPAGPITTINRLFASAAKAYGRRVIGVILSGFLKDGTDGLRAVHEAGRLTIVQDPAGAEFPSMPASAMANLPVTFCLNLSDIGAALELLVRRETQFETGLAVAVRTLRARTALLVRLAEQSWPNPGTHEFLVKELASLNRDLGPINDLVKEKLSKTSEPSPP
jgi:chemotaxis response regulator CheB